MSAKFRGKKTWALIILFLFACGTGRVIYGIAHAQGDTGMGIFSMFYGLYGTYWHSFLEQRRGSVLIDQLINAGQASRSGY